MGAALVAALRELLQRLLVGLEDVAGEADEEDLFDRRLSLEEAGGLAHGDLRRGIGRIAEDAATDRGEGDGPGLVLDGEGDA